MNVMDTNSEHFQHYIRVIIALIALLVTLVVGLWLAYAAYAGALITLGDWDSPILLSEKPKVFYGFILAISAVFVYLAHYTTQIIIRVLKLRP